MFTDLSFICFDTLPAVGSVCLKDQWSAKINKFHIVFVCNTWSVGKAYVRC